MIQRSYNSYWKDFDRAIVQSLLTIRLFDHIDANFQGACYKG